uniref:Uncharacterized protein n=1 Tax=Helianthus annuus TaxID=4232 RepID=A0A251TJ57_HELAN
MIIEEVNEQLLRLFWGFKTLTLDTSPFTASTSKRTTPERWIDRESSSYSTTEREERRRWRNRPSSPVGHPVGLQSDGDGLWWLSSYRKREAEESKGTVVVVVGGIRGRRPSCTHHLSFKTGTNYSRVFWAIDDLIWGVFVVGL